MGYYFWGFILGISLFNMAITIFPRTYEINVADVTQAAALCPSEKPIAFNKTEYTVTCDNGVVMTLPVTKD